MKKIASKSLSFVILFLGLFCQLAAADAVTASFSPTSVHTYPNQSATFTLTERINGAPYANDPVNFYFSYGSGTLAKQSGVTDSNGVITNSFISSVPSSSATVSAYRANASSFDPIASLDIYVLLRPATFPQDAGTQKVPATASHASSPAAKAAYNAGSPPSAPLPQASPTLGSVSFSLKSGKTYDASKSFVIPYEQTLHLAGTVMPNGIITLTIHSNSRSAVVTADAQGKWSYDLTNLTVGVHSIKATVTDPATKLTSASAAVANFKVKPPVTVTASPAKSSPDYGWLWFLIWQLLAFGK